MPNTWGKGLSCWCCRNGPQMPFPAGRETSPRGACASLPYTATRCRIPSGRATYLQSTASQVQVERKRAVGSSSIPGSLRLGWGATRWLMPGARSKRCRQARPLTGVGRLEERERPACGCVHQCRTRSLSARSAHPRLSRAASPALLARENVGMDVQHHARVMEQSDLGEKCRT